MARDPEGRKGLAAKAQQLFSAGWHAREIVVALDVGYGTLASMLWPEKKRARRALNRAVQAGGAQRPESCESCGRADKAIQAHHADYAKPLDVEWLCTGCHAQRHAGSRDAIGAVAIDEEVRKAIWAVGLARQVETRDLLLMCSIEDVVNTYRGWLGKPPRYEASRRHEAA
jgi:hypothetical protein